MNILIQKIEKQIQSISYAANVANLEQLSVSGQCTLVTFRCKTVIFMKTAFSKQLWQVPIEITVVLNQKLFERVGEKKFLFLVHMQRILACFIACYL